MARTFDPLERGMIAYTPRQVTFSDLNSSPMKDAIKEETVPFFIAGENTGLVFACTLVDKIRMLKLLLESDYMRRKYLIVNFVWPGKKQSHVFQIEPDLQLRVLAILEGEDKRKIEDIEDTLDLMSDKIEELRTTLVDLQRKMK